MRRVRVSGSHDPGSGHFRYRDIDSEKRGTCLDTAERNQAQQVTILVDRALQKGRNMKRRHAILAFLVILGSRPVVAQQPPRAVEPEYLNTFFLLDRTTGSLKPLEREPLEVATKIRALGFGGARTSMSVHGEQSTVRYREGQPLEFVVLAASQQIDPQGLVTLYLMESDDGRRKLVTATANLGGASSVGSQGAIPINAAKYGKSSFTITPAQPLPPGEYLLTASGAKDAFCFGVDEDASHRAAPLEKTVAFQPGESIPLGIEDLVIKFRSVEVTSWPKAEAIKKAQATPADTFNLTVKFTYTNRGKQSWHCQYDVAILDDAGQEIGSGARRAKLGGSEDDDTHRVSVKIKTLDFPKAAKMRIRLAPRPD